MTLPSWTLKLAAAAVIPVILGVGVAMSAPSQPFTASLEARGAAMDDDYQPGETGVDVAAVTGPTTSEVGRTRNCGDPSWPIVPFSCRDVSSGGKVLDEIR